MGSSVRVIYGTEKAQRALDNFFKESTLGALREIALRQAAHEVETRQKEQESLDSNYAREPMQGGQRQDEPRERILIHITESPTTAALIRRGRRVADYLNADCFAVCVPPPAGLEGLPKSCREAVEQHLEFARKLHIETRVLEGDNAAETLVDFARRNGVTQIFLAKNRPSGPIPFLAKKNIVMEVVRLAKDRQVTVVADRRRVGG